MPASRPANRSSAAHAWFVLTAFAVLVDRGFKAFAMRVGEVPLFDWFSFTYFRNTGIAFSIPVLNALYWPLALACGAAIVVLFLRALGVLGEPRRPDLLRAAMPWCVLLGAASNLYDRAAYGWVIDYLLFFRIGAWNIADVMIVVGLAAAYWQSTRAAAPPETKNTTPSAEPR